MIWTIAAITAAFFIGLIVGWAWGMHSMGDHIVREHQKKLAERVNPRYDDNLWKNRPVEKS